MLFSGTAPFAHYIATPLTLFVDAVGDVGELLSSKKQSQKLYHRIQQQQSPHSNGKTHITFIGHSLGGSVAKREATLMKSLTPNDYCVHYRSYSAPGKIRTLDTLAPWLSVAAALGLAIGLSFLGMPPLVYSLAALGTLFLGLSLYTLWAYTHKDLPPAETKQIVLTIDKDQVRKHTPGNWSHMARFNVFSDNTRTSSDSNISNFWHDNDIEVHQRVQEKKRSVIEATIGVGHGHLHQDDSWWQRHLTTILFVLFTKPVLITVGGVGFAFISLFGPMFRLKDKLQHKTSVSHQQPKLATTKTTTPELARHIFSAIKVGEYGYTKEDAQKLAHIKIPLDTLPSKRS